MTPSDPSSDPVPPEPDLQSETTEAAPTAVLPAPPVRRRDLRLVYSVAAAAATFFIGLAVGLAMNDSEAAPASDVFDAVKEACAVGSSDVRVGDGGDTLSIDRAGAEVMPGATMTQFECVLDELDVPAAVRDHIDSTRALDGYQEDSFDEFALGWTYHPDDGVNMTITREA